MKKIIILCLVKLSLSYDNITIMNPLPLNNPTNVEQQFINIPKPISKFQQYLNDNASLSKAVKICELIFLLGRFFGCILFMLRNDGFFVIFSAFMSFIPPNIQIVYKLPNPHMTKKMHSVFLIIIFIVTSLWIIVTFIVKILWKKRIQWNLVNIIKYSLWGSLMILILMFCLLNPYHILNGEPDIIGKILCWSTFIINIILLINSIVSLFFGTNSLDNPTPINDQHIKNEDIDNLIKTK